MECAICLNNISSECPDVLVKELSCGHRFHFGCIYKWSYINKTCPLCRQDIILHDENKKPDTHYGYIKDVNQVDERVNDCINVATLDDIKRNINDIKSILCFIDEKNRNFMDKNVYFKDQLIKYSIIGKIGMLWASNESKYSITFVYNNNIYDCIMDSSKSVAYYMCLDININQCYDTKIEYVDH